MCDQAGLSLWSQAIFWNYFVWKPHLHHSKEIIDMSHMTQLSGVKLEEVGVTQHGL